MEFWGKTLTYLEKYMNRLDQQNNKGQTFQKLTLSKTKINEKIRRRSKNQREHVGKKNNITNNKNLLFKRKMSVMDVKLSIELYSDPLIEYQGILRNLKRS